MEQGGASAGWGARGFETVERLLRFGAAEGGQGDTPTAFRADTQVPVRPALGWSQIAAPAGLRQRLASRAVPTP